MKNITLGTTGITVPQNAFGALPIQRVDDETAVRLLRRAYEGGMRFFDTARGYTDSEHKLGLAFEGMREKIYIASKTGSHTPKEFEEDLAKSLSLLKTDYLDIYQFHCADRVYRPGDGTGMYECMQKAKAEGKIRHIGITAHKLNVAMEAAGSGLYETLQFPFSYLASEKDLELVELCRKNKVGFIAMKALSGGLITHAPAAMAFMSQFDNVLPIWGIQRDSELEQWLGFMENTPEPDRDMQAFLQKEKKELSGDFCRGCGYCMPCPQGIQISSCARMSLMLRRAPSAFWLGEPMQAEMKKIENCVECRQCTARCPYELDTPMLLKKNYEDYKRVLAGEATV